MMTSRYFMLALHGPEVTGLPFLPCLFLPPKSSYVRILLNQITFAKLEVRRICDILNHSTCRTIVAVCEFFVRNRGQPTTTMKKLKEKQYHI